MKGLGWMGASLLLMMVINHAQAFLLPGQPSVLAARWSVLKASGDPLEDIREGPVEACRRKITAALKPLSLVVQSAHDDPNGSHIAVKVVSEAFAGKSRVARQQMVYKAIWDELQGPIHAVDQLVTLTPEEEAGA